MTGFELAKLVGQIPTTVLPRAERAVLRAMADRYPKIWPSVPTLATEAGYGAVQTRKALNRLLNRKLIDVAPGSHRRGGHEVTTRYVIDVEAVKSLVPTKPDTSHRAGERKPDTFEDETRHSVASSPTLGVGPSAETRHKVSTNKPATPNKTENKTNNRVEKTLESMLLLFDEKEGDVAATTKQQRENLAPIIVGYGPAFVIAAWKEYLKQRSGKQSWPLVEFTQNFAIYVKRAVHETFELRRELFYRFPCPPEGYWLPELEFYPHTPEEVAAIETQRAWKRVHRDDPDIQKSFDEMPLNNAGILLDLLDRDAAWEAEHKEEIERLEDAWQKQQIKDDPDGTRYIPGEE